MGDGELLHAASDLRGEEPEGPRVARLPEAHAALCGREGCEPLPRAVEGHGVDGALVTWGGG